MQPKTVKKYIEPVEQIADDFCARIRSIRDGETNETPPDFGNEMNKWALESIACIGMDTRLGLLGDIEKNSDAQRMIQVSELLQVYLLVSFISIGLSILQSVHDFFNLSYELEVMPSVWKYVKTPPFKQLIKSLHVLTE